MNEIKYDSIIVGDSLVALAAAYIWSVPIIVIDRPEYTIFDEVSYSHKIKKAKVWQELAFHLSMAGLMPFSDKVVSIRQSDSKKIVEVFCENNSKYKVSYDFKRMFPPEIRKNKSGLIVYEVIDWFDVKSGRVHDFTTIVNPQNRENKGLVNHLMFFKSPKYSGKKDFKDVASFSFLTKSQLDSEDNAEYVVRLETLRVMEEKGIKGMKNGKDSKGKQLYLKLKIEHLKRTVRPCPVYYGQENDMIRKIVKANGDRYINSELIKLRNQFGDPLEFARTR